MRSRLLISVALLPTILETSEEGLSRGPVQESPPSPSLDDYVRSICQLAQPASALNEASAGQRPSRLHRSARACERRHTAMSPQDVTTCFSSQGPLLPGAGTADPLDWLFGESQETPSSRKDLMRRTGTSADSWGLHRQMDTGEARSGPRARFCDARGPGHSLLRLSQGGHLSSNRDSRQPCPNDSILRALHSDLPVIHEL
ncbi:protein DEPP1 [Trichechus manatus latirostris]|uniref:Protein DEPP1 n=1 Tax=Trichechus manatus latirostris TaxID=127582 RepID=A0A2Y9G2F3_TRIMA|nr:protein DEPP1 [Trichechus manatus latirostris]